MATITTSGIAPGFIIEADQLLRVIYALNGVSGSDIIISGSLGVTGSSEFASPVTLLAGAIGDLFGTASWAITASYALNGSGGGTGVNIANPGPGRVILSDGTSTNLSASVNLIYTGSNFFVTGSTILTAVSNETDIITVRSGSSTFLTINTGSLFDIYSDLFNVRNPATQQPVLTVSQSIVQIATHSIDPSGTAPNGGIYFTSTNFYVGLD